jgi:hypothetical protein
VTDVRTAADAAANAARALADAAQRALPGASVGRRRIVDAATTAASAWSRVASVASSASSTPTTTDGGASPRVGDAPDRARAVRVARDATDRAVRTARDVARQVESMSDEALRRAWQMTTAPARATRAAIARTIRDAADRAERVATAAATTAAQTWGGAVSTIGGLGVVALLVGMMFLLRK